MDIFRRSYKRQNGNGVYWIDPATSVAEILNQSQCQGTIVINSTAGLESLIQQKPLLCLGKALYRYRELVEIPDALDSVSLYSALEKLINRKVDSNLVKQYCAFLYDTTQIDGNIDCIPEQSEINRWRVFIKGRLANYII
jgi:capsule polysaccharide modification protein KpsS